MKRILLGVLFILTGFLTQAQSFRTDVAVLDSVTHIATYYGGSKIISVKDSVSGGFFYLYQGGLPVNGSNIVSGANSSKWRRIYSDPRPSVIGGGGGSVSASQGADVSGSDVRLGVAAGSGLNAFTTDRQINMGNRYLSFMGNKTNNGEFHLKFDDTLTATVGTAATKNWITFRSPDKSFSPQDFRMHSSVSKISGVDSLNHVFNMGFGFNAGGAALQLGRTGIGYSLESHYEPVLGTAFAEMHEWFISRAGTQIRFKSTTIDKATNNITTDYRASTINFKNVAGTDWMAFQENSVVGNLTDFTAKSYNGRTGSFAKAAGDAGNSGISITDAFNGNALYINKTAGTDQALHVANGTSYFKDNVGLGTPALTGGFGNYVTIGTTYPAIRFKHSTKDYFLGINDPSQTGLQFQNFATSRSIFYFREDGNGIIGNNTTPDARLTIHAEDAGSSNYALRVRDNSSNELMAVRNDGLLTLPSLAGNIIGKRNYGNSTNAGYNPLIFEPLSTDTRASRFYFKHNQTAQTGTFPNNVMKIGWNPDLIEGTKKGLWLAMEGNYQTTPTDSLQEVHIVSAGPTWGETRLLSYTLFLRNGLLGENQTTNIFSNLDIRAETTNFLTTTNRSFASIAQNKTNKVSAFTLQSANGVALNLSVDSAQNLISFNQQFGPAPRAVSFFNDGNTRDVNMYNFRVTTNAGVEFQGYAGVNTDSTHDFGGYSTRWKRFYAGQIGSNRQIVGNLAAWGNHFLSGELIKYTPYSDNNSVFLRMTDAAGSGTTFSILNNGSVNFPTTSTTKAPFNVGGFGTIPTSPTAGDVVFDASDSSIKVRSGSNWIPYYYSKEVVAGTNITIARGSAWNVPDTINASGGGGLTDGDKGDITVGGSGTTLTIDNQAVTYAKIQNVTDARLLGRSAGSAGSAQEITVSSDMSLAAGVLGVGSNVPLKNGTNTFTGANTFNTNDVTFSGINPTITGGAANLKYQDQNDGRNLLVYLNTRKFTFLAQQTSFSSHIPLYFDLSAPVDAMNLHSTGTLRLNSVSTAADVANRKLYVNGSVGFNKDSLPTVTTIGTENFALVDNSTGQVKKVTLANAATSLGLNNSGTWTPTFTYTTNTSATSSGHFRYQQIGDQIYIQGDIVFIPTSTGVAQVDITLPFANGITNSYDVSGTGVAFDKAAEPVEIFYNNSGGTIAFKTTVAATGTRTYKFTAIMHYQAP